MDEDAKFCLSDLVSTFCADDEAPEVGRFNNEGAGITATGDKLNKKSSRADSLDLNESLDQRVSRILQAHVSSYL